MSAASDLFKTLSAFKSAPHPGTSPQQLLVDYCRGVLGGIERVHFDFKEKDDATSRSLNDSDKRNLAKAISGFANGGGGVLIWGLKDETIDPKPISDVARVVDSLLQLSHQATAPAVLGIDGDFVPSDGNRAEGFALVFVPESDLPPHRVVLNIDKVKDHYYVRSGSSFVVASHSQLEDMFGRRPRPHLSLVHDVSKGPVRGNSKVDIDVKLSLRNDGRGIARFPFLSLAVAPPHGLSMHGVDGNGHFGLTRSLIGPQVPGGRELCESGNFGGQDTFAIHSGVTLAVTKARAIIRTNGAETKDLRVTYGIAADGIPYEEDELVISADEMVKVARQ